MRPLVSLFPRFLVSSSSYLIKQEFSVLENIREQLWRLHAELPKNNLVMWTGGNISARDPETGLVAIKPSGHPLRGSAAGAHGDRRPGRQHR